MSTHAYKQRMKERQKEQRHNNKLKRHIAKLPLAVQNDPKFWNGLLKREAAKAQKRVVVATAANGSHGSTEAKVGTTPAFATAPENSGEQHA